MRTRLLPSLLAVAFACLSQLSWGAQAWVSLGGPGGSVSQFKATGGPAQKSYATPPGAVDIVLGTDDNTLFVGTTSVAQNEVQGGAPSVVARMNASTGAVLQTHAMPASVVRMVRNVAGDHIYATGIDPVDFSVVVMSLDLNSGATARVPVPGAHSYSLYPIAVTPDGSQVIVPTHDTLTFFDAASLNLLGTMALPANGIVAPPAVTLDGALLLAVGQGKVQVVDLAQRQLVKTIPITTSAAVFGAVLAPDGTRWYVNGGTLSVIDVASLTVAATLVMNQDNPYRMGITADGATLFATDLTVATTAVVDTAALRIRTVLKSIAPPYAVAVRANGSPLLLNENSNRLALLDTTLHTVTGGFPVGDAPLAGVLAAGKLLVPEVANLAVQPSPLTPVPVHLVDTGLISANSAAAVGSKVYVNSGSLVKVVDATLERATKSIVVRTGSSGLSSALSLAGSGDGRSLLASYVAMSVDMRLVDGGIVKLDTLTGRQKKMVSFPFVPDRIAADRGGNFAYGIVFGDGASVGRWNLATSRFEQQRLLPGSPTYTALGISPNGATLYLTDKQGKLDVVDAASLQLLRSVATGGQPSGIAVSADGSQGLVTDGTSNTILVVDLASGAITGTVDLGAPARGTVFVD